MGRSLAHTTTIVWETFGERALRRFVIRVGLEERLQARKRLRGRHGRIDRRAALAAGMMRRLFLLLRERPSENEGTA